MLTFPQNELLLDKTVLTVGLPELSDACNLLFLLKSVEFSSQLARSLQKWRYTKGWIGTNRFNQSEQHQLGPSYDLFSVRS